MSKEPTDFEEWCQQHLIGSDFDRIIAASQSVHLEVSAKTERPHTSRKHDEQVMSRRDYEGLFVGLLEPRKSLAHQTHPRANQRGDDVSNDDGYESVPESELAQEILAKAIILGWEEPAQQIIDERNYSFLVAFANVVNKALASQGTKKKDLVQTRRKKDTPKQSSRLNYKWARKPLKHDFGYLYDRLVDEGYLEDTGKDVFLFFFAGQGETTPAKKLIWNADPIILGVLIDVLSMNRRPWALMELAFDNINTNALKSSVSRAKNNKYGGLSYEQHYQTIQRLLS